MRMHGAKRLGEGGRRDVCIAARIISSGCYSGETSGNRLMVKEIFNDCDNDSAAGYGGRHQARALGRGLLWAVSTCRLEGDEMGGKLLGKPTYDPNAVYGGNHVMAEAEAWQAVKGQSGERDPRSVSARGFQYQHDCRVRSFDRRSGYRVHADSRAGDGALRTGRHSGCGADRSRLGIGSWRECGCGGGSHLRQTEFRQGAVGFGCSGIRSAIQFG